MFKRRQFESRIRRKIRMTALPYGEWQCRGGRRVLFNRRYEPLWERDVLGLVTRADPGELVPWRRQVHFYSDGTPHKAAVAIRAYERFTGWAWCWEAAKIEFREMDASMGDALALAIASRPDQPMQKRWHA